MIEARSANRRKIWGNNFLRIDYEADFAVLELAGDHPRRVYVFVISSLADFALGLGAVLAILDQTGTPQVGIQLAMARSAAGAVQVLGTTLTVKWTAGTVFRSMSVNVGDLVV